MTLYGEDMNTDTATTILSLGCTVATTDGRTGTVDRFGFNTETGMADRTLVRVGFRRARFEWISASELTRA